MLLRVLGKAYAVIEGAGLNFDLESDGVHIRG